MKIRPWGGEAIFFFQAEDGIRGASVTGVQTCALPILLSITVAPAARATSAHARLTGFAVATSARSSPRKASGRTGSTGSARPRNGRVESRGDRKSVV